jgi:hypothetical protein
VAALQALIELYELTEEQMKQPGHLPTTAIVTPHTEFSEKFLIEMSRGCPEKCRYCWASFGMGRFRWHPTEYILASLERARPVTNQLGFVATAVGDHPDIEKILREANGLGFRTSVSSIRIPAVTEGVLEALHDSGDRSITLAPETGTDELRVHARVEAGQAVLVQVSYDPAWRAASAGRPLAIRKDAMGFMAVDAPPGGHDLRLTFTLPPENAIGRVLTVLAGVIVMALFVRGRRPSRPVQKEMARA